MEAEVAYLFEEYALDPDRRELRRGGALVSVEPKVFDLLELAIRERERVVSKDDLIAVVWQGRIVSESALTTCINAARKAIGDSGEVQRLIKTLPRKGIRFVGAVQEAPSSPRRQDKVGALTGLSVVVRAEARAACVLMGEDEGAIRTALDQGRELLVTNLEAAGGRIVQTTADTVIAVFGDPPMAVSAAGRAREALANSSHGAENRIHYRFGIATGEVHEGAEGPGGSAVERAATLALGALPDSVQVSEDVSAAIAGATVLGPRPTNAVPTVGLPPQLQALDVVLPTRPSILLLPFKAVGADTAESEPVAEGLRIDIQNALTKMSGVFLIGAGSANAMRGLPVADAAARAGVQYVLEGVVRKSGERVRVSVQLTDIIAGSVLWSEAYDRTFDDKFELQDEITQRIVTSLDVKLAGGEQARIWHKGLTDLKAREAFYSGIQAFFRMNAESMTRARTCFGRVTELAPGSPLGATWIALCLWFESTRGWAADPTQAREQAGVWAERAAGMEDADGQAHTVLGNVRLLQRRFDEALSIAREALNIRPGCTNANAFLANVLLYCGDSQRAVLHARRAIRYMPVYPPWFVEILAAAYRDTGMVDLAIIAAREVTRIAPSALQARLILASALSRSGWSAEARRIVCEARTLDPNLSLSRWASSQPYRDDATLTGVVDDLRRLDVLA
jgi:TolB-like protein/DNA-binding winged helix-turn-helix (wHTH) protein/tetratricopeptide (TPR) repeat protein